MAGAPHPDLLPAEFPVFPLPGALLLPHGKLPLNIFEPRYLAMVNAALGGGRQFGMIQPDPSRPRGAAGPALYRVGCLGRIASFSETDDGRYLISLTGVIRFAVQQEIAMQSGFRRVQGDFTPYHGDLAPPLESHTRANRAEIRSALRRYFTQRGFDANWETIDAMPDETLVTTLCMACPFEVEEKQALLEAPTPTDRADALLALLQIETHAPEGGAAARRAS